MTDTGAVYIAVAIVVAAGIIYLAAQSYNETVAQGVTFTANNDVAPRAPIGFALSGA